MSAHRPATEAKATQSERRYEIALAGCTPTPLANYLKALGVLRLVSEQADPEARGYWRNDQFFLVSWLGKEELKQFFLKSYYPTPITSPWNGRAGFLEGDDGDDSNRKGAVIVREIEQSKGSRFQSYRTLIQQIKKLPVFEELNTVRSEVKEIESQKKTKRFTDEEKERLKQNKNRGKVLKNELLKSLRGEVDENLVQWIDACLVVLDEDTVTAPILGSGGNEGSMDYSVNHLINLAKLIDPDTDEASAAAGSSIAEALFREPAITTVKGNPGFLGPSATGGPNMTSGFSGDSGDNAWTTVLMLEGVLLFAAAATRRLNSASTPSLSFPFLVEATRAGHGGIATKESTRPELWVPLWDNATSLPEVEALLDEGRATLNRRPARDGLDMSRAIAMLGVHRGVTAFQRFGFFERRGQGYYLAAPLQRVVVRRNRSAALINELDQAVWLDRARTFAQGKHAPHRVVTLVRQLEDCIFELSLAESGPTQKIHAVLTLLGRIQRYLASSPMGRKSCPPVPWLSKEWIIQADDQTPEFAIVTALAGLHGRALSGDQNKTSWTMPMRTHLAPESAGRIPVWDEQATRNVTWGNGSVEDNLIAALQRRLLTASRDDTALVDKPLAPSRAAPLAAIAAWLDDTLDSHRIAALLPGLMLARIPAGDSTGAWQNAPLPAAYRVLKPFFCTNQQLVRAGLLPEGDRLPLPPELVRRVAIGDIHGALQRALPLLRVARIDVDFHDLAADRMDGRRLLAALLVPLTDHDLIHLLPTAAATAAEETTAT